MGGGGTPILPDGGVPPSTLNRVYPYPAYGVYPIPSQDAGTPNARSRGVPHPRSGRGYPNSYSGWRQYPQLEQHSMYLLHGGQYASCVHAGGLSCMLQFNSLKVSPLFTRRQIAKPQKLKNRVENRKLFYSPIKGAFALKDNKDKWLIWTKVCGQF